MIVGDRALLSRLQLKLCPNNVFSYQKYMDQKKIGMSDNILNHFTPLAKYPANHIQQRKITTSIMEELVIGCAMPLSLPDSPDFRK